MLYPLAIVLLLLAGWSISGRLGMDVVSVEPEAMPGATELRAAAHPAERIGLTILLGLALLSALMFIPGLFGLPIRPYVYLPLLLPFSVDGLRRLRREERTSDPVPPREVERRDSIIPRVAIVAVVAWIALVILVRCCYLPNAAFDSLAGFDLLGKVIAAEGKFHVSLFEYSGITRRGSYPPFTALTLAWGYQCGLGTSMAMMVMPLLGFGLWMYGFARRALGSTASWLLLLLCLLSPDFYAYCHLPLSHLPVMMFAAPTLLHAWAASELARDTSPSDVRPSSGERTLLARRHLAVAALFGVCLMWSRADAFPFVAGVVVMIALHGRRLGWRGVLLYPVPALVVAVVWQLYVQHVLEVSGADRFMSHLFFDRERVRILIRLGVRYLWLPTAIGFAGWFFAAGWMSAIASRVRPRMIPGSGPRVEPLALALCVSILLYWLVFYQTDPARQDPLPGLMSSSYRRGVTAYVLPFWFVFLASPLGFVLRNVAGRLFASTRERTELSSRT